MRGTIGLLGIVGLAALASVGCSGNKFDTGATDGTQASLRRAHSCGELDQMLKGDALMKMNARIDAQIDFIRKYGANYGYGGGYFGGIPPVPAAAGTTDSGANGSPKSSGGRASQYSETNTQVKGVDEADIVKTDGKYIYLLHGQSFEVLNAWPANELAKASSTPIEGYPTEMYVADGKVVIYSQVGGQPIYDAAKVAPRSDYSDAVYATGAMRGGAPTCMGCDGGGYYGGPSLTKITVLSLTGAKTTLTREMYFEGSYQDSRRMGSRVRTVLSGGAHGPSLEYYPQYTDALQASLTAKEAIAAYESLRAKNTAKIQSSTVADWMPYLFERANGGAVSVTTPACEDVYSPTAGSTEYGVTQVVSFDLTSQAPAKGAAITAAVDTVYANQNAMVLATRGWQNPTNVMWASVGSGSVGSGTVGSGTVGSTPVGSTGSSPPPDSGGGVGTRTTPQIVARPVTMNYTHLHRFDLSADPSVPVYVASGTVAGQIKDRFSLDERSGTIFVATTEQRSWLGESNNLPVRTNQSTFNHVFSLQTSGAALRTVGDVGELAPGESIQSVRYVGTRGYVVTFRQIDPLFVIDLADPKKPSVLAALKIPGFSEYMQPIDDGHLLTIGRDVDQNRRAAVTLQIFDVTDPRAPKQMHKFAFDGSEYGASEAESNPKAFTYFPERNLLTFPYYSYGSSGGFRSSAELFRVDLQAGFSKVGSVDHSSFFGQNTQGYCGGYFNPQVRRGLFLEDTLFSISYGGVLANNTKTLAKLGSVALSSPTFDGASCR